MNINATNAPVTAAVSHLCKVLLPITEGPSGRNLRPLQVTRAAEKVAEQFGVSALDVEHMFSLAFGHKIKLFAN
jgi:hypothetical protein